MAGIQRRARRAAALTLALTATVGCSMAADAKAGPLAQDGMWIWYVNASGGSAKAIAKKAKAHGMHLVLIKSSDGPNAWSQFTPGLVDGLQDRGMTVCAWQFVYGDSARKEAQRGAEAVNKGADCLVIDAESHYEGRYAAADRYMRALRRRVGKNYPVGFTSFPWVDYHLSLPYSVFLGRGGAQFNLPQVYWKTIGSSVESTMGHTYRWNRPYDRPIMPLGQTYENPPGDELRRFRKLARGYRSKGVSWWSWQETSSGEWNQISGRIHPPYPKTPRHYPGLSVGSRGDVVLLLQELLLAAGRHVHADGVFGSGTADALRRFQSENGLERTGHTSKGTWRALTERQPKRIPWAERGRPGFLKSAKLEPRWPAALEVPSTPGRP